ncbi:MAG: hypothetical protein U0794_08585 [Isosphaeraceae bacterium]
MKILKRSVLCASGKRTYRNASGSEVGKGLGEGICRSFDLETMDAVDHPFTDTTSGRDDGHAPSRRSFERDEPEGFSFSCREGEDIVFAVTFHQPRMGQGTQESNSIVQLEACGERCQTRISDVAIDIQIDTKRVFVPEPSDRLDDQVDPLIAVNMTRRHDFERAGTGRGERSGRGSSSDDPVWDLLNRAPEDDSGLFDLLEHTRGDCDVCALDLTVELTHQAWQWAGPASAEPRRYRVAQLPDPGYTQVL